MTAGEARGEGDNATASSAVRFAGRARGIRAPAWLAVFLLGLPLLLPAAEIPVIAYHDITEAASNDPFAITRAQFLEQIQYLRERGYEPISLARLEEARQGRSPLPARPVLLTFDDGLKSYRDIALPVLTRYGYPSVLSVVTAWADGRRIPPAAYRGRLMSWQELREVSRSPLVEVISHTDDLHHTIPANPQGNEAPAGIARRYDSRSRYETEAGFYSRVRADLARSRDRLRAELGRDPVGIAWPYGEYDQTLIEEAARLGMVYHLTLDSEPTTLAGLPRINRRTFYRYRSLDDLDDILTFRAYRRLQQRFVRLDMDCFAGRTPAQQDELLSRLLARLELLQVNAVLIAPLSRDGERAYFANPVMPVEADLLNRLLHQITARNGIKYRYLKLPARPRTDGHVLYTELARLNRFSGIVLTGVVDRETVSRWRTLFWRYLPNLKLGVAAPLATGDAIAASDFVLVPLEAQQQSGLLERQAVQGLRNFPRPVFFLLGRPSGLPVDRLVQAMQALRAAGARHYGYDNDDFLRGQPAVLQVVGELNAHTVWTSGD